MKNLLPLLLSFSACFASCVRSDVPACPDGFSVSLFVQDKNYTDDTSPVDENLPFGSYIQGVYYVLHNTDTGADLTSGGYLPVTGSAADYAIPLTGVPAGHYRLTAWGNLDGMATISAAGAELHPSGAESTDIYLGSQAIDLTPGHEQAYRIGMKRTKGLLEVECVDFPAGITRVDIGFTPAYAVAAGDGTYSGTATVTKSFPFGTGNPVTLQTILAPTFAGATSNLTVSLYEDGDPDPVFVFPASGVTIARNGITRLQANYNVPAGSLELWIMIDGQWTILYQMTISDN